MKKSEKNGQPESRTVRFMPSVLITGIVAGIMGASCENFIFPEQEGNTPDTGQRDHRVDDAADDGVLTAEEPWDYVKLEKPDGAPVDCSDDDKNQW